MYAKKQKLPIIIKSIVANLINYCWGKENE